MIKITLQPATRKTFFKICLTLVLKLGISVSLLSFTAIYGQKSQTIIGAGASFPYPLYAKMFEIYYKKNNIKVNYQSIGSGGGIRQLQAETVDFGATDTFLANNVLAAASKQGKKILHVPIVLGAISIAYNLRGVTNLRLDGSTLAEIFMGNIKKWNDPKIAQLNSGLRLPSQPIIVVHRSDGSGTTAVLAEFLARSAVSWKKNVGVGKSLNWFRGSVGAKGNEGVTGQLKQIPGAIGYISLNYALEVNLPVIAIKNAANNYIKPSVASARAAASTIPADGRINLSSQPTQKKGYPISTFTWIIVYENQNYSKRTPAQAKQLKKLLTWMVGSGQQEAKDLHYAPLSSAAQKTALRIINTMHFKN